MCGLKLDHKHDWSFIMRQRFLRFFNFLLFSFVQYWYHCDLLIRTLRCLMYAMFQTLPTEIQCKNKPKRAIDGCVKIHVVRFMARENRFVILGLKFCWLYFAQSLKKPVLMWWKTACSFVWSMSMLRMFIKK